MNFVVNIEKMGHRGLGIARWGGKVVLVPFAAPEDRAEVSITRAHRDYDEAEIVKLIKPSSLRREPPCSFFGTCGGCQLQHLPLSFQRTLKEEIFREMLRHQGEVDEKGIKDILFSSNEFEYRSHSELHVDWQEKPLVGFMTRRGNNVVPIDRCLVVNPLIQSILVEVSGMLKRADANRVTDVTISCDFPGEKNVITFFSSKRLPDNVEKTLEKVVQEIPQVKGLYLVTRQERRPLILWKEAGTPSGVLYSLPFNDGGGDLILEAWPEVFRQVNPAVNRIVISIVVDWIQNLGVQQVLELYAGMGNFTIPVSFVTQNVLAIESNPHAVDNAKANALRHVRKNIQWITGSVKGEIKSLRKESFDLIIMDPPRSGAKEILKEIIQLNSKNIIYISCEPATLARDIQFLKKYGSYGVKMTQPLDMFPQTFHVESITLLKKI